jgi:3-oxoacyl-(acyl-carrier-protein) synthase
MAGIDFLEIQHSIFLEKGIRRINPFIFNVTSPHAATAIVIGEFGFKGFNMTIASGSNSGIDAVYMAMLAIERGDAEIMLAGAGEAPITPYICGVCCASGLLSRENTNPRSALKPYDIRADGTVLGEGGAILLMEEIEHALRRKAKIHGEILGFSSTIDPSWSAGAENCGDTLGKTIETGLSNARLSKKDIDYISAHGSGVLLYDVDETLGIKKAFGDLAYQIPVTSIKPVTGDSFSVSGVLQLITCLLVINSSVIPPTANHLLPDPRCDLNYVPKQYVRKEVKNAIANVHGFGGNHSILIVGKVHPNNYPF